MSDPIQCDGDGCLRMGRRLRNRIAPEGWMYSELVDQDEGRVSYIYACSHACKKRRWHEDGHETLLSGYEPVLGDKVKIVRSPTAWVVGLEGEVAGIHGDMVDVLFPKGGRILATAVSLLDTLDPADA